MATKNIADFYPLSPMQQGMLFHSLAAPESGVYVEQLTCLLKGDFNLNAFHRAWDRVIERHPILRTGFLTAGLKEPVQVVHRAVSLEIDHQDWSACPPEEQQSRLAEYFSAERARGFELAKPPLMRLGLIALGPGAWQFVWTYHHLLLDGWSHPMVFQEVLGFYQAFAQNRDLHLDLPRGYRDYIVWLKKQDKAAAEQYWRAALAGFTAPTPLADPLASADEDAGEGSAERELWIPEEKAARLQSLARQLNLTLNTLVSGAWAVLLSRYAREEDICFGATVSGRPADLPGAEQMVGLFINTLPVRVYADPRQPAGAWLRQFQSQLTEMRQYEYSPLIDIQGWSQVPRHLPLFETILVFENYPVQKMLEQPAAARPDSLTIEQVRSVEQTNFPLTAVAGAAGEIMLKLVYDRRLYTPDAVDRMLGHWANLVEALVTRPDVPLGRQVMTSPAEVQQIVRGWNQTAAPYPADRCAYQLFEDWAARQPEAVALDFEGQVTTYGELNRQADHIARLLAGCHLPAEALVGLAFPRSPAMIAAVLGVHKAGLAYLPLDPAYPADRLAFMIQDSAVSLVLADPGTPRPDETLGSPLTWLEYTPAPGGDDSGAPAIPARPDGLAYIIYTSGSTGRPKGVLLEHRGLTNLVTHYARQIGLGPGARMLQFFSYSFDGSVADIFAALTSGAALCLARAENLLPGPGMVQFLRERRVTHGMVTPSALASLPAEDLPDLRVLLTGGEAATREVLWPWAAAGRRLINAYGPTEATVISTLHEITDLGAEAPTLPIGRPLPNTTLYIVDPALNPVPVGVGGEVLVGGVSLARGYLNRPDLTAERFIPDPFNPGGRLYRTGDLARFTPQGEVEYLGRVDDQVKIRGFRVELGEIEARLARHPEVAACVVAAAAEPGAPNPLARQLAAYLVLKPGSDLALADIRAFLKQDLPEYMLPTALVVMDALPLSPSGKVNRRALPAPERQRLAGDAEFIAPRDDLETELQKIWEEVLNIHPIGMRDNFFDLGGHSLLAVRLIGLVRERLGRDLALVTLFQSATIEGIADSLRQGDELIAAVDGLTASPAAPISETGDDGGPDPLIALQKRGDRPPLFFVHPSGGSTHWYTELSGALGKDQPFYAFQAQGINGDRPLHTSITAMAACYVRALQRFQPHGPYRLGSWSLGVIIVYEMAQQLHALGETVDKLIMLDQGPAMLQPTPRDDADYLVQIFGKNLKLDLETLRRLPYPEQVALVLDLGKKARFIYPDIKLKEFTQFITILRTQQDAWRDYPVQAYPGKITLFRAAGQDHTGEPPDLGWAPLALGGLEIQSVPGDHLTMIHKPHVRRLAEALKKTLEAVPYG